MLFLNFNVSFLVRIFKVVVKDLKLKVLKNLCCFWVLMCENLI